MRTLFEEKMVQGVESTDLRMKEKEEVNKKEMKGRRGTRISSLCQKLWVRS